jgi:hypothetical protein
MEVEPRIALEIYSCGRMNVQSGCSNWLYY